MTGARPAGSGKSVLLEDVAASLAGVAVLRTQGVESEAPLPFAALSVLTEAWEGTPVLAIVDDAHWLDNASAEALLFVARRLELEHVALVFAVRDGDVRTFEAPDLPQLHLTGLDLGAVTALLSEQTGAEVATEVAAQLLASTGGNPVALVELPRVLSADQLANW